MTTPNDQLNLDIELDDMQVIARAIDYKLTGDAREEYLSIKQPHEVVEALGKNIRDVYKIRHDATKGLYSKPVERANDRQVGHMAFNDFITDAILSLQDDSETTLVTSDEEGEQTLSSNG